VRGGGRAPRPGKAAGAILSPKSWRAGSSIEPTPSRHQADTKLTPSRPALAAPFRLGRGDGAPETVEARIQQARAARTGPRLPGAPPLADMLEHGLERLGIPAADVDGMI
jgi:hypothetical protein